MAIITRKTRPNPKRRGSKSHARFAAYRVGDSLEQYALRARLTPGEARRDARYDIRHGHIEVSE